MSQKHINWFQSTPPMQGATGAVGTLVDAAKVSIHAPYAGSDCNTACVVWRSRCVSIHAPYAGSDADGSEAAPRIKVSIHAPYAGSDARDGSHTILALVVSIHAPYAGSD